MVSAAIRSRRYDRFKTEWYHGTNSRHYLDLRRGVDLNKCKIYTDFGRGFYLTSDFRQASKHATNRCFRENDQPIVFVYKVNISELRSYNGKVWITMDEAWAQFIYQNRSATTTFNHSFDFVYGGVADGQLDDLIEWMDDGIIDLSLFYEKIAKYSTYDQLSLHNQNIFGQNILTLDKVVVAYAKGEEYIDPEAG